MLDALVIGGGPAGLSAALVLGRSRRTVAVIDDGRPRNAGSRGIHGYLGHDGTPPAGLRATGRAEAARYPGVRLVAGTVVDLQRRGDGFVARLADGGVLAGACAVIAIGIRDRLPPVPGLAERYGRSVHHCPYCDGWEHHDRPIACLGADADGLALKLSRWSRDLVWLSEGGATTSARAAALAGRGVRVVAPPLARVEDDAAGLALVLADGTRIARSALFLEPAHEPWPAWVTALGCELDDAGAIRCDRRCATCVPGLYVAGDASADAQLAIVAAAEGARAAVAIDQRLLEAELGPASHRDEPLPAER